MSSAAGPRSALHSVRFEGAEDFIDEVRAYDTPFMSFTLGMVMDYVSHPTSSKDPSSTPKVPSDKGTYHAIFDIDNRLISVLVQTPARPAHILGYPSPPPPPTLSAACALLAKAISPSSLRRQIGGPRDAVQAFLSALPDVQTSRKTFSSIACSASLRTLPVSPLPGKAGGSRTAGPLQRYTIRSARPEDAPGVLPLVRQFSAFTSTGPSPDETVLADMRAAAAARMLYAIYAEEEVGEHAAGHAVLGARSSEGKRAWREEGNIAGYLLLGFATPRAVVIRHVFVHPEHRKRGLAERIVRAVTRACLGASPEPELDPDANGSVSVQFVADTPGCGVKSAVCLFYNDPGAARVYRRCGFVVGEDARDPVSGESLCYAYELRDIVTP